jgi:hypothetical protein
MVEPRYKLNRNALSMKNRHMVKCYPSYNERIEKIEDFQIKLKFYKDMIGKQGNMIDFLSEYYQESEAKTKENDEITFQAEPLSKSITIKRKYSFSNAPKIDPNSWMKNNKTLSCADKYQYSQILLAKQNSYKDALHESTLYIDHYC